MNAADTFVMFYSVLANGVFTAEWMILFGFCLVVGVRKVSGWIHYGIEHEQATAAFAAYKMEKEREEEVLRKMAE